MSAAVICTRCGLEIVDDEKASRFIGANDLVETRHTTATTCISRLKNVNTFLVDENLELRGQLRAYGGAE